MPGPIAAIEQQAGATVVRLQGDLTVRSAGALHRQLRALGRRRDLGRVVVDFAGAERIDSAGMAAVSLARRRLEQRRVPFEVTALDEAHRAVLAQIERAAAAAPPGEVAPPGALERIGERVLDAAAGVRAFIGLMGETVRQTLAVATRRAKLPAGSVARQIAEMGADGVPIIALLSCMLGLTVGFQAVLQLQRFGAGVFVADTIGLSMVRELAPLMSAIILTGRTGAAIAAELGTMRVRSEIDALSAMGISPVRFLVVPRLLAITVAGPALALFSMAVGIAGGMLIAQAVLDLGPVSFFARVTERVTMGDFLHGMSKSFVFSWIVGFSGAHLGMRAGDDASSVGAAATKTVVTGVSLIIVVDAIFATVSSLGKHYT
ncbi:MAG TPA: ABC transporter permease [Kofleriaceae bacterium]|nr:ABC transporter permease [Kofleriaceae bacterium]